MYNRIDSYIHTSFGSGQGPGYIKQYQLLPIEEQTPLYKTHYEERIFFPEIHLF
jgi:hypothetical protein